MDVKEKVEKVEAKAKETKGKIIEGAKKVGKACNDVFTEKPDLLFKVAMVVGGTLVGLLSGAVDTSAERNKKCLVEDKITGCDYLTKHPLTNSEILELSNRMSDGETHGEALSNMGLLRKDKKRK